MSKAGYSSAAEAKAAGWFSRRHQSSGPSMAARDARLARKQAQLNAAQVRQEMADERVAPLKAELEAAESGKNKGAPLSKEAQAYKVAREAKPAKRKAST